MEAGREKKGKVPELSEKTKGREKREIHIPGLSRSKSDCCTGKNSRFREKSSGCRKAADAIRDE